MKKVLHYLINIISMCLIFASFWAIRTYGDFTGDELIFHLLVPLGNISTQSFQTLLTAVFLPGIFIGALLSYLIDCYLKKGKLPLDIAIILLSLIFALYKIHMFEYMKNQIAKSTFIEENYVETKKTKIEFPENKKNLIYIYLESMENTYANKVNGGNRKENLIPNLTKLAKDNTSFSNTEKLGGPIFSSGTNWTAAAMVSQTSGIPLKITMNLDGVSNLKEFFPNVYTLGDVLEKEGYKNYLLLGSDAGYGRRKEYFEQHGSYNIYDLNSALADKRMTEKDKVWWGFDDTTLFKYAREQLTEISKKNEPFNYTLLTADTHFEDGYLTAECDKKYADQYSNVINCSDKKLSDFIKWLKEQDFYENTVIILVGDHISMDSDYFDDMDDYIRTTYNVIINSDTKAEKTTNRTFASFDMFPTTLAALGAKIEGNQLGLGVNLYSNKKTIFEENDPIRVNKELNKYSIFYSRNIQSLQKGMIK